MTSLRATPARAMLAGAGSAVAMWLFDTAFLQRAPGGESARLLVLLAGAAVLVVLPTLVFVIGRDYLAHWRSGPADAAYRRETRAALRRGLVWLIGGGVALLLLSSLGDFFAS